jgi:hypothetical protein
LLLTRRSVKNPAVRHPPRTNPYLSTVPLRHDRVVRVDRPSVRRDVLTRRFQLMNDSFFKKNKKNSKKFHPSQIFRV